MKVKKADTTIAGVGYESKLIKELKSKAEQQKVNQGILDSMYDYLDEWFLSKTNGSKLTDIEIKTNNFSKKNTHTYQIEITTNGPATTEKNSA